LRPAYRRELWLFGRRWLLRRHKKTLRAVRGQYPIAALTSVQCLSCAKHVSTFPMLHTANFDDSFDPPSSGTWDPESIRHDSYERSRTISHCKFSLLSSVLLRRVFITC
jgi:hypothetical protein